MDEISVGEKKYLKAKLVARELGYTNDYVGQLCRAGKVDAKLVGRTWYVDPTTVKGHKQTRYRSTKAATHRDLKSSVSKILIEQPIEKEHFYDYRESLRTKSSVQYEPDENDLLPKPKKSIPLPVELADAQKLGVEGTTSNKYRFEAPKREETKFFGTLKVTDFITEVPVEGEMHKEADTVTVIKGAQNSHRVTEEADKKRTYKIDIQTPQSREFIPDVKPKVQEHTIPVTVDEEVVRLPIVYHLVTVTSFFLALMIGALMIGLESSVTATSETLNQAYTFAVENLSALIYLIK